MEQRAILHSDMNSFYASVEMIPANRILLETDAPFSLKISSAKQLETELEILVGGISRIRGEDMEGRIEKNSERILL